MSSLLSTRDYRSVLSFVEGLHGCRSPAALGCYVVRQVPTLIDACQATWNVIVPARGTADVVAWPAPADPPATTQVFARHMLEHPCIAHYLHTGVPQARKISDFLSAPTFERSAIYGALYQPLGYADQLATFLAPPGPQIVGLALGRPRRSFTERDRAVLDLLRSHLLYAHRTTQALTGLQAPNAAAASAWLVPLRVDRAPWSLDSPPTAALTCLERHFGPLGRHGGLPMALQRWCARQGGLAPQQVLRQRTGAYELHVRVLRGSECLAPALLIVEHRPKAPAWPALAPLGLSRRETDVLNAVAAGLGNNAAAALLGISPGTVRKHLEHAYAKLGVTNRTAAAAIQRAACETRDFNPD